MSEQSPSAKAVAFATAWLGIEHEPHDWDVGIWGGDYAQVGNSLFNLIDEPSNGPRSNAERDNLETELIYAFAGLLDLYAAQEVKEAVETEKAEARLNLAGRMKEQLQQAVLQERVLSTQALDRWRKSAILGRDTAMRVGNIEMAFAFNFVVGVYTKAINIVWRQA